MSDTPLLSYALFLFCFFCPLCFPFFKCFLPLRAFKEFLNFRKQTAGKDFCFMLGDICVRLLFCRISPFLFSCQGAVPNVREFSLSEKNANPGLL